MTRRSTMLGALVALCVATTTPTDALAAKRGDDERIKSHPAYVADPGLVDLATGDTRIVEVTIRGALLRSVARIAGAENEEFRDFLANLLAVNAVILENWRGDEDDVDGAMRDLIADLDEDWERIVRIQDPNENLRVYIHTDRDDEIDGLLVLKHGGHDVVFANIVGPIDLEFVAAMAGHFEIPGLERVPKERPALNDDGEGDRS